MNLMYETLESGRQNCFLVGDLYHWELGQDGYFMVEKNLDDSKVASDSYFENLNIETITQDIQDS